MVFNNKCSILGLLISSFFLSSCAYYDEKNPLDPSLITSGNVSWQKVSSEFFEPRCAICHANGEDGINVSDYNQVVLRIGQIKRNVITRKNMPPDSALTAYEDKLITTWINDGTPL